MKHRFLAEAQQELDEAVEWYEKQAAGVGIRLLRATREAVERICAGADTFAFIEAPFRCCPVNGFSYIVIYAVDDFVEIVAVMHTSRRPGYWRERLSPDEGIESGE